MQNDLELVAAWRAGDHKAGSALFERHFESVYRFFCNKVGGDIDDLVQQTFLGCLESAARFRGEASFRTLLFSVARHKLYDHVRATARGRGHPQVDLGAMSLQDFGLAPPDVVAQRQEHRLLLRALRRLPLELQVLVELSYWEGLSDTALAAVMEIPTGTLKSRLRKARQLLEAELAELARSPEELRSTLGDLDGWAASVRDHLGREPGPSGASGG